MKVRIKFSKTGALVYIGHLDVMRYFQKLFRRADIPISYSEGFSPHQILSFSHPLPLGMESDGEYADIELTESISSQHAIDRLMRESVPEITILSFKQLPDKCDNAMSSVRAARYTVDFGESFPFEDLEKACCSLLDKTEVIVTKVTKKNTKEEDIRPYIYELKSINSTTIEMLISSGSIYNVKPEHVVSALTSLYGYSIDENDLVMRRIEQYTSINDKLVCLDDIGNEIK